MSFSYFLFCCCFLFVVVFVVFIFAACDRSGYLLVWVSAAADADSRDSLFALVGLCAFQAVLLWAKASSCSKVLQSGMSC